MSEVKKIQICRVAYRADGVFGVIMDDGLPFALTLERPWLDNKQNVSCIPRGFYTCRRYSSERYPDTFEVLSVTHRANILIHTGNIIDHSAGCILIGESYDMFGDTPGIASSKKGFAEFLERLSGVDSFLLHIYDAERSR